MTVIDSLPQHIYIFAAIFCLLQQTIQALQVAVVKLEQMAANVESAGKRGASAMEDSLEAMSATEARQRVMNDKMGEFVGQICQNINNSQGHTKVQSTGRGLR